MRKKRTKYNILSWQSQIEGENNLPLNTMPMVLVLVPCGFLKFTYMILKSSISKPRQLSDVYINIQSTL